MESVTKYLALIGKVVDGRYTVREVIGIGGMAIVLKAYDNIMNRDVALKILNDELHSDEDAIRRFVNESKAVAMLSEPHIVSIYDVAFTDTLQYIAMEFVDGTTLKDYMKNKLPLSVQEALHYTEQILMGLEHAHEKGIVHQDIKPQNILLLDGGHIKVADFGIAKLPTGDETTNGQIIGTINYISPEQVSAEPTDFHTDLYSLGVMLYEMITGKLPFIADNPKEVARMHKEVQPLPPSHWNTSIPHGLNQLILKALQKKQSDRFRSAHSMLRAVQMIKNNPDAVFDPSDQTKPEENTAFAPAMGTGLEATVPTETTTSKPETRKVMKKIYKRPRRPFFPVIFGVFVSFFIVAGILGLRFAMFYFNFKSNSVSETLTVPDLVGQVYSAALKESLQGEHVAIKSANIQYDYNSAYPVNTIIEQSPVAGSVKKISGNQYYEIKLIVSGGHKSIQMPDLSITPVTDAKKKIESLQLQYKEVGEYNDSVIAGYVIRTEPASGSYLNEDEEVIIYVSKGQGLSYTEMPNLVGRTLSEAKNQLQKEELVVGKITRKPSDQPNNTVISQSVTVGQEVVKKYTVVDIVVSIYMPDYSDNINANNP